MTLTPEEFYAHALAAADAEGRLPLARMTAQAAVGRVQPG